MPISNFFKSTIFKLVCVLHILFLFVFTSVAQDSSKPTNKWNILIEPYLMFPNLKGTTGVGTLPDAQVDADAGDIFSHLKMGAMLFFEMGNNKWAFSSDILYMNLDQEAEPGKMINSGNINLKQFAWELSGLRKLLPWLEAGIGGRFNSLKTEMNLETKNIGGGTTSRSKSLTQQWFDPIIIARVKSSLDKKFIYLFRGDIGGFSIGSDIAWQLQAYLGYRFSKLFQATAGYRIISVDYNKGSGEERFLYDIDTFGPVVRFGFNF